MSVMDSNPVICYENEECAKCHKSKSSNPRFVPFKLSTCTGCGLARYCSSKCQQAHWSTHKDVCKQAQATWRNWDARSIRNKESDSSSDSQLSSTKTPVMILPPRQRTPSPPRPVLARLKTYEELEERHREKMRQLQTPVTEAQKEAARIQEAKNRWVSSNEVEKRFMSQRQAEIMASLNRVPEDDSSRHSIVSDEYYKAPPPDILTAENLKKDVKASQKRMATMRVDEWQKSNPPPPRAPARDKDIQRRELGNGNGNGIGNGNGARHSSDPSSGSSQSQSPRRPGRPGRPVVNSYPPAPPERELSQPPAPRRATLTTYPAPLDDGDPLLFPPQHNRPPMISYPTAPAPAIVRGHNGPGPSPGTNAPPPNAQLAAMRSHSAGPRTLFEPPMNSNTNNNDPPRAYLGPVSRRPGQRHRQMTYWEMMTTGKVPTNGTGMIRPNDSG